jgi:hypothetical protein
VKKQTHLIENEQDTEVHLMNRSEDTQRDGGWWVEMETTDTPHLPAMHNILHYTN